MAERSRAPRSATLRVLFGRIWGAVLRNKGLIVAVFVTAVLEAFFTKAPIVLAKPVGDALQSMMGEGVLGPTGVEDEQGFADSALALVHQFSYWSCDLLGIEFEPPGAREKEVVVGCALLAALSGVFGAVFIYLALVTARYFATKVVVDLRNQVAAHLLRLPLRYFGRQRMGELLSNLTNNTQVLARAFTLVADHVLADPLMILANVVVIAIFAPYGLWILIPAVPAMALPIIRLGRKVHRRSGQSLAAMEDATESMNQMLSGIKTVKTFQLEELRLAEFERNNESYLRRTMRMLQAKGRSQAFVFVGYQLAFAALLVLWVVGASDQSLGDMAIVLVPITTTYTHVKRMARAYNTVMESLGALDAIERILAEDLDPGQASRGTVVLDRIEGRVAMQDVSFAYGQDDVLRNIDFAIEPGTSVALVGPSGAGKSTLIDLLVRLHDPGAGRVLIDGHDLRDIEIDSYRRRTAMVVQQSFLFNTTIRDNIACGRPGATAEAVEAAARAAQIHDFVLTLPSGYDTVVGERGSNLSGGQMQRIAIARAMVRDPAILFLDEATSALDSESEEAVQAALNNLMKGRTSFVIAHRLSTIRDSDLILVLEAGRIVERGTHAELVARGGLYRRLIDLQTGLLAAR